MNTSRVVRPPSPGRRGIHFKGPMQTPASTSEMNTYAYIYIYIYTHNYGGKKVNKKPPVLAKKKCGGKEVQEPPPSLGEGRI